mgnify:CR=1 FL=1
MANQKSTNDGVMIFFSTLCGCAFLGAGITFLVYVIMGLSQTGNDTIQAICPGSELWMYSLMSLLVGGIVTGMSGRSAAEAESPPGKTCGLLCGLIPLATFVGWGWDQIYNTPCIAEKFSDTLLYTMTKIQFYIQVISIGIYALLLVIVAITLIVAVYLDIRDVQESTPNCNTPPVTVRTSYTQPPIIVGNNQDESV